MDRIEYPVPQPMPPLAVRCLSPNDAAQIAALYRTGGRDGAWCAEENTVRALFEMGAVWWGGFADGELALCAASAASTADTPQAAALRGALASGIGHPAPERFLLPPAVSRQGEALAGPLLLLLTEQLFSFAADTSRPQNAELFLQEAQAAPAHWPVARWPREGEPAPAALRPQAADPAPVLLAALPVKAPAPLLAAYFAAGFAAVRMRPLVSLRPHYLLRWRGVPGQAAENDDLSPKEETDALRRVYLPFADTLAVSRLLERGFCATTLCRSSADERTLIRLERENG